MPEVPFGTFFYTFCTNHTCTGSLWPFNTLTLARKRLNIACSSVGQKVSRNNSSNYRRPFPPLPPPRPLPPLDPPLDNERPKATPPRPLLAKLTAFRTFKSLSSAFGFLVFLLSLSIFARRFNDVLFSFSMDASVGSNYSRKNVVVNDSKAPMRQIMKLPSA